MEDRRKLYLQGFFKATPAASRSPEPQGGGDRRLSSAADVRSVATEMRDYKAAYDSIPTAQPKEESLLEKTRRLLRQASILSSEQLEFANVATDPTYIHIEGRLTKKLLAAIDPAELERRPGPEDLWDTFLPELKTPTPPPTPPPPPAPRVPRRKYFFVKGKVVSVNWPPPKKRASHSAPSTDDDQRSVSGGTVSGGGGGGGWQPSAANASIGSGTSASGSSSSSSGGDRLGGGVTRRTPVAVPHGRRQTFGTAIGPPAAPSADSATAASTTGADGATPRANGFGRSLSERSRLGNGGGGGCGAAPRAVAASPRAALPRCPLCSRKACVQHAFEATAKLRRFMKKPASRGLTFYSLYAS